MEGKWSDEGGNAEQELTLPDEGLAGVKQDVAAFHDHPFDGQVLPDVLGVAHLVVHHPDDNRIMSTLENPPLCFQNFISSHIMGWI